MRAGPILRARASPPGKVAIETLEAVKVQEHPVLATFDLPISWTELIKRTVRDFIADDCLSLAAQLAYYFFLALFPALLFLLALASFFSLSSVADDVAQRLGQFAPPDVLRILTEQMRRISDANSGGLLTLGFVGALWSSSSAMTSIVSSLNRAYDIEDSRPWWRVRLTAIGLTLALALLVLLSFALVIVGPFVADLLAERLGLGAPFEWAWHIVQWPVAFLLVTFAIGVVFYFAPDAEQYFEWITPGAVLATTLWLLASLAFRLYVVNFTDYNATYGTIGGVIVLLLWFYISGLALLAGAEMNAEIEHASPHGKDPGEKRAGQRKQLGKLAEQAYQRHIEGSRLLPGREAGTGITSGAGPARARGVTTSERGATFVAWPSQSAPQAHEDLMAASPSTREGTSAGRKRDMAGIQDTRPIGELFTELTRDLTTLVRKELELARVEVSAKISVVSARLATIAVGAVVACAGLFAVVAGLVLVAIELGLPAWGAAFVVGAIVLAAGGLMAWQSVSALRRESLVPRETLETLKENAEWAKHHTTP